MGSQYLAHCLAKGRFLSIPRFTHICEAIWAHPVIKEPPASKGKDEKSSREESVTEKQVTEEQTTEESNKDKSTIEKTDEEESTKEESTKEESTKEESVTEEPPAVRYNYVYSENHHLYDGGPKEKCRNNIEAIRLLKTLKQEGRHATPEEQLTLAKYVGWGGLANALTPEKRGWERNTIPCRTFSMRTKCGVLQNLL